MKKERRKFSAGFKGRIAIEALRERGSLVGLSKRFDVHPNMISKWKQEFMGRSSGFPIFATKKTRLITVD